ncbi:MAG TPA: iron-sulfur cluster biosynthesis family protein [Thermoplasmata archaeon]|nr:iron-sulfur cluster biosynthesis family protein [Thermoplasmata archaeon]
MQAESESRKVHPAHVQVDVRPPALEQVRRLIQGQKPEIGVRIYAQAGGKGCCGGGSGAVQFGMAFAKARPDDEVIPADGFSIIVDPGSAIMVNGAIVDYVETLSESGFKITNPTLPEPDEGGQAGGCGSCGSSSANGGGCGCGG